MLLGPVIKDATELHPGVKFSVKAENDIYIALSKSNPPVLSESLEIIFGGWNALKTVFRTAHVADVATLNHTKADFQEVENIPRKYLFDNSLIFSGKKILS